MLNDSGPIVPSRTTTSVIACKPDAAGPPVTVETTDAAFSPPAERSLATAIACADGESSQCADSVIPSGAACARLLMFEVSVLHSATVFAGGGPVYCSSALVSSAAARAYEAPGGFESDICTAAGETAITVPLLPGARRTGNASAVSVNARVVTAGSCADAGARITTMPATNSAAASARLIGPAPPGSSRSPRDRRAPRPDRLLR